MKLKANLAGLSLLLAAATPALATRYTFQTSFRDLNTSEVVGAGQISFDSNNVITNGNYLLSNFTNISYYFSFENGLVFQTSDLYSQPVNQFAGIDISSNQFNFTTTSSPPYSLLSAGSLDFLRTDGTQLSFSPNQSGQNYGETNPAYEGAYAAFYVSDIQSVMQYQGGYGIGSATAPSEFLSPSIPEPSTYGLIGIGALAVAIAARRRKLKTA
jgi:hypothetical protein